MNIFYKGYVKELIGKYISKPGNQRDLIIKKNILLSFVYQFATNVIGLLIVPLSLTYLDNEKYGVWINATIMVAWLQNMNFGMGFGMQNRVAESIAINKKNLARQYVSIAYKFTFYIAIIILGLCAIFFNLINWNSLFNTKLSAGELKGVTIISLVCFSAYFFLGNINNIFNALKETSVPKLLSVFSNLLTIIFLFGIIKFGFARNNLILAGLALALPIPLTYFVANIYYFKNSLAYLRPYWATYNKNRVKDVMGLSFKFFIMQITSLLISQVGVFIITQYLGPSEVTPYSIVNRYFYFVFFIFSITLNPYWSGFTEAIARKEYGWIRKSLKKLLFNGGIAAIVIILFFLLSFYIIPVWTKHKISVLTYFGLTLTSAIFTIINIFSSIISTLLNGINELNFQMYLQIFLAFISITLSIILIKNYHYGSVAINITGILIQIIYLLFCSYKIRRLIFR